MSVQETKRVRRPAGGGYPRGEETRLRIIMAAIELFGEHGFEGASTREIAARAEVNAPALQYYFENKEGLYKACAEYIADTSLTHFEPFMQQAREVLEDERAGSAELIDAFLSMQGAIADKIFNTAQLHPNFRLFFAREQTGDEPDIASDILQQRMRGPLNEIGTRLVARVCGLSPDDPVVRIRAFSLHGQLVMFHIARRSALTVLEWPDLDGGRGAMILDTIRAQTRALLEMWSRGG